MTKANFKLDKAEVIRDKYTPEQILNYFGIEIDSFGKCLCVFHDEDTPSMQVYDNGVFCFGCRKYADVLDLAKQLWTKKNNKEVTFSATVSWFNETKLPEKSNRKLCTSSCYEGEVPMPLIDYWHSQLDENKYNQLMGDRLLTRETVDKYKLGWRPDKNAFVIPFWRGELGNSLVDTVQFRNIKGLPKYFGLTSHTRGSIMNMHFLDVPQEYVVILFGAYDSLLAYQDNIIAVALNGCSAFGEKDKERLQQAFSKQKNIFIVPDNTPSEYTQAYKYAEWLDAEVRFFDTELPDGCDYIDYRKLSHSAEDFKQDVLGIEPIMKLEKGYIEDILTFLKCGDPYTFASVHAILKGEGAAAVDVARTIAKQNVFSPFSVNSWAQAKRKLWKVKSVDELVGTLDNLSNEVHRLTGAW